MKCCLLLLPSGLATGGVAGELVKGENIGCSIFIHTRLCLLGLPTWVSIRHESHDSSSEVLLPCLVGGAAGTMALGVGRWGR